ncbi:unannotated protein [freshwater metagenome]|uniref:Unannotated protein n=1 Tax=freshwater metagenome TaxID=449393 RepID=A0A6J7IMW5_9ZZZZ
MFPFSGLREVTNNIDQSISSSGMHLPKAGEIYLPLSPSGFFQHPSARVARISLCEGFTAAGSDSENLSCLRPNFCSDIEGSDRGMCDQAAIDGEDIV